MNAIEKYQILNHIGMTYWLDRAAILQSDAPLFGARCLVLLPEKITSQTPEEDKILTGMVNVLGLQKNEICIAWIQVKDSVAILKDELLKWAPESILVMDEDLGKTILESISCLADLMAVQVTYHPKHLQNSPEDKKKAYQDLLSLKQVLANRKVL